MMLVKCSLFAAAVLASVSASAKTCTWIGSSGNWSDGSKWQDGAVPEDGDDVVLEGNAGAGGAIALEGRTTAWLASFTVTGGSGWSIQNGTLALQSGARVIDTGVTVEIGADLASDGEVTLVKRGAGTLSLAGANTATTQLVVEGGRLQAENEGAYGPVPESYKADAIVLRNGGALSRPYADNLTVVVGSTRGITLDGAGALCARGFGRLQIDAPIVGDGELQLLRQSGEILLNAANAYTGRTVLASDGTYAWGTSLRLRLGVDGALPATTTLAVQGTDGKTVDASVYLQGTTQRVVALAAADRANLIFFGPGTARFGTDADGDVSCPGVTLSAGATLAYAGAGTVAPTLYTAADTTFALESGSLLVPSATALSASTLRLAADRVVNLAEGVLEFPNSLVLEGSATLAAADSALTLLGNITGTGTLAVTGADAVTFGTTDAVLRALDVPIAGAAVTLDGWVRATVDPSGYTKATTCTLVGPYSGLSEGGVVLDGTAAGVDDIAQIGASASVTVRNGGRFVISAQEDMTASNAFEVDAQSKVSVGGSAMVDLTGATFKGGGELNLVGAGVTLAGDLTGVVLNASQAGVVCVPEGQTLTLGAAKGTIRKTGPGLLVLAGSEAGLSCHAVIEAGEVRAAAQQPSVLGNVTVRPGASLVLDADEQIRDDCYVFLDGTFDLNGHSETVQRIHNTPAQTTPAVLRDAPTGAVVNTSAEPATVFTVAEDVFYGSVAERPGRITWRTNSSNTSFFGPAGGAAPSEIRIDSSGSGCNFSYTRWSSIRFVLRNPRTAGRAIGLAEIQLTWKGVPLPPSAYNIKGYANQAGSGTPFENALDGKGATYWKMPDGATNATVSIALNGYPRFDGYRLVAAEQGNAPQDWDVYVHRVDISGWMLADSRRGEKLVSENLAWTGFNFNASRNYAFAAPSRPGEQFGTGTRVTLERPSTAMPAMRVSSMDELRIGALAGPGNVRLEVGSWFSPGDMAAWTGAFLLDGAAGRENMARILLDADLGGAAQPVRFAGAARNVSVENAGETPVSLLVDDGTSLDQTHLRLADGHGPMGLVKRGDGATTLAIEESGNTGATVVEAGRLRVSGAHGASRPVSARYLRIWPKMNNNGNDSNGFNWGMNDFQLLDADGNRIPFPSGTTTSAENGFHDTQTGANLIDGNIANRCLVWNTAEEKSLKTGYCSWVVIDMKQSVSFAGYRWYTPHNNAADQYRVPVEWTLETSDNGAAWTIVASASDPYTSAYGSGNNGLLRGPYGLTGHADGKTTLYTLPAAFLAGATTRSTRAPALKARYFRFEPHEMAGPFAEQNAFGWMVSEFGLFRDGARVAWPAGAKATLSGGVISTSNGSSLNKFCDNVTEGGLDNANLHRVFVTQFPSFVTVDAGAELAFDAYAFWSAAGGCRDNRIPTSWTLSLSADGVNWIAVDSHYGEKASFGNYQIQGPWSVADKYPLLGATCATDALGDASPVTVAAGAELEIDSDYEKFGTLSGPGTVTLTAGAVAEINACVADAAAFSGAVTGAGTLAVCGDRAQTFADAALTVPKLELNGGVVAGTASFGGGDLVLACNGGALWGTLSGVGTLSLTGTPKIALPADTFEQGGARMTLVQATSISADAQAAFQKAEVVAPEGLPGSWTPHVSVSATEIKVSVGPSGTVLYFR